MHVFQIHSVLTTMLYIIGTHNLENWMYMYLTEQIVLGILVTKKIEKFSLPPQSTLEGFACK